MADYKITYSCTAQRELEALDTPVVERIFPKIDALEKDPRPRGCQKVKGEKRVVLSFNKELAPIKVAVLPLLRNREKIVALARKIRDGLKKYFYAVYDDPGSIGKLYRRQDEVGTPYCVTVDVKSLEDNRVTVRERDTMRQERNSRGKLTDNVVDK